MRRRQFIAGLGSAAAWPVAVWAQQVMRRVGVLQNMPADDPLSVAQMTAFAQAMQALGWTNGRNLRIDIRFTATDAERIRRYAAELVALMPDAILATGAVTTKALQQSSRTIPIIFTATSDPVGEGLVASLARPGGNTSGFAMIEYNISVKWLELLKEIAPGVTRAAVIRDPTLTASAGQYGAMLGVAASLRVELTPIDSRDVGEIERAIVAFARGSNGGLIVTTTAAAIIHRDLITGLAARHRLPAVYAGRHFVDDGGLLSYGADHVDPFRKAAGYIDRVLKGERTADLPVQLPTRYDTVLNLKAAKALGLAVPNSLLVRADEVIE